MSRYERKIYFERLVELRLTYATLGDDDRTVAMTIDEAVDWAERELASTPASGSAPSQES